MRHRSSLMELLCFTFERGLARQIYPIRDDDHRSECKFTFGDRTRAFSTYLYTSVQRYSSRLSVPLVRLSVRLSHFLLQSPFQLYACPLIAAFCLQDQIIVTAVECSLRGAFVLASASP